MTEHVLKIHPQPLADLLSGAKTAEVRDCSDRDFQVGDTVRLRELTADGYTGREVTRTVSHVQVGYGLPVGLCVLSYAPERMETPRYSTYCTNAAESLAGIAARQLKDERLWLVVRDLNQLEHPDMGPHDYYPVGSVILLPYRSA